MTAEQYLTILLAYTPSSVISAACYIKTLNPRYKNAVSHGFMLFIVMLYTALIAVPFNDNIAVKNLLSILIIPAAMFVLFKDKAWKSVLVYIVFNAGGLLSEILYVSFLRLANIEFNFDSFSPIHAYITAVILAAICYVLARLLNKYMPKNSEVDDIKGSSVWVYCILQFLLLVATGVVMKNQSSLSMLFMVLAISAALLSVIGCSWLMFLMKSNAHRKAEAELMRYALELEEERETESRTQLERAKLLKSELKNSIYLIREHINNDDSTSLNAYIKELCDEIDSMHRTSFCNRSTINALLFYNNALAEKSGIKTEINTAAINRASISDKRLCAILSNLFSNAIEGAAKTEEKKINLSTGFAGENFIIKLTNSAVSPKKELETTKEDPENHGIGISIIKHNVAENGGNVSFSYENGVFTAIVSLLPEER